MKTKENKHIDLTYLKELSNGSNAFINEMITVFMEQIPIETGNLEKHLLAKDWKQLKTIAHKIKPSFLFMGIKELESKLKLIEEYAANEKNLALLPNMITEINKVSKESMAELEIEKQLFN